MSQSIYVLGVSMSRHDRAACLLKNGKVVGAIAEERIDRRKRSIGKYGQNHRNIVFPPLAAITYVLQMESIGLDQVDLIVCGRSMGLCRDVFLQYVPACTERVIEPAIPGHHRAHAYSAFGTSPFSRAAVLVIDEQGHHFNGQFEKCTWFEGSQKGVRTLRQFLGGGDELSLGMFYNAFAALTSLNEAASPAAGKLMGLASFGKPRPDWPELIFLDHESGDTHISLSQLDDFFSEAGLAIQPDMKNIPVQQLDDLSKYKALPWHAELAADLARKAQEEMEKAILHICTQLRQHSTAKALAYAGGVALNCTANRRLSEAGWSDIYVHPAATDDGNAVGLALYGWVEALGRTLKPEKRFSPFTGRCYSHEEIKTATATLGLQDYLRKVSPAEAGAERITRGEVVCWFQGGSEWGPRALGGRSILANPLTSGIKSKLNATIKYREGFRPFAISSTLAALKDLVQLDSHSASLNPYMLLAGKVKSQQLQEVQHVDGTVRYQVVDEKAQPALYNLIQEFGKQTGLCAIVNTSFNTLGEPLVETPMDAVQQFLVSGADALIAETWLLSRVSIPESILRVACDLALKATLIDPLSAALGLEAAGYIEVAVSLLERMGYTSELAMAAGSSVVQQYYGLQQRAAIQRKDNQAARSYAEMVLRYSGMSSEAVAAARYIAEDPNGNEQYRLAGDLTSRLALPGATFRYFNTLLQ